MVYRLPNLDLPALRSVSGRLRLPGSKSISNRVLLLAALCPEETTIAGLLDSEDTQVMLAALRTLGCQIRETDGTLTIRGLQAATAPPDAQLFLANAGTAMRPLAAALAILGGQHLLDGVARMRERPIGDLVDALRSIGCQIEYRGQDGYPPLAIGTPTLHMDGPVPVRGSVSSQFLTALLMALPLAEHEAPITIEVTDGLISRPYIEITLRLMARFGVQVQCPDPMHFVLPAGSRYRSPGHMAVESDASTASYFIAAAMLSAPEPDAPGLRLDGVGADSIQGDIRFVDAVRQMGARVEAGLDHLHIHPTPRPLRALDLDCNHIPDAAMTLAMLALFADGPSTLRNIASWRVKETDRLTAMATELRKLGAQVEEGTDFLRVHPIAAGHWRAASLATYKDHRMAMCGALAAFNPQCLPMRIQDPACVSKTFPDFFEALLAQAQPAGPVPVICVDGPSASGKGTLAKGLARALGYGYLDSGALYRAVSVAARQRGLQPTTENQAAIVALARTLALTFHEDRVLLNGHDVSDGIRSERAGLDASVISAWPELRHALLQLQRDHARAPGLVTDGRDMGTVVFPDAPLKVFLTASVAERAKRRQRQLMDRGIDAKIEQIRTDLEARDARDRSRAASPLEPAADAVLLDNSGLSIEESVALALGWWQARQSFDAH